MKPEKKEIHYIRKGLQEKHCVGFTSLSTEGQNELICMVIREHIEQMRKERRHR